MLKTLNMKKKVSPSQQSKVKDISSKETQETACDGPTPCDARSDVDVANKDSSQEKRHLQISQSDGCFLKFLNEDRQKLPSFCDITVTVSGKMYHAHKVVLAFGSGYFHARFSENPELHHVTIDNIEGFIFGHLLNFLYTSEFEVSESQIPALAEAACFLDMMEAVNLLAKWVTPAQADQESDVQQVPLETPDVPNVQTSGGAKCSFCSRTFCYKKSLENHLAKTHSAGCHVEEEQNLAITSAATTRRSARQRRTPAKFESQESGNGNVLSGKPSQKTPKDDDATFEEEEEEEDDESEEEQQNEQEEQSSKEGREETSTAVEMEEAEGEDDEKQEEEHVAELSKAGEQAETQKETEPRSSHAVEEQSQVTEVTGHVFPEGLAPVVVQNANKKTLKCPKCDKTFDRIGENYNVKADGCNRLLFLSYLLIYLTIH